MSRTLREYPTSCDSTVRVIAFAGPKEDIDGVEGRRYVQFLIDGTAYAKLNQDQVTELLEELRDHVEKPAHDRTVEFVTIPSAIVFRLEDFDYGVRVTISVDDRWVVLEENQVRDLANALLTRLGLEDTHLPTKVPPMTDVRDAMEAFDGA